MAANVGSRAKCRVKIENRTKQNGIMPGKVVHDKTYRMQLDVMCSYLKCVGLLFAGAALALEDCLNAFKSRQKGFFFNPQLLFL